MTNAHNTYIGFLKLPSQELIPTLFETVKNANIPLNLDEIATYKSASIQMTKLIGRLMLAYLLKKYAQLTPDQLSMTIGKHGKPYLTNFPHIHFNISHSADMIIVAISKYDIGVDIEKIGKARMNVAGKFFSSIENELLNRDKDPDQLFYQLWSAKESYVKLIATGLTTPLNSFSVITSKKEFKIEGSISHEGAKLSSLDIDPSYASFLASFVEMNPNIEEISVFNLQKF